MSIDNGFNIDNGMSVDNGLSVERAEYMPFLDFQYV